jgi:hypothetical protein
MLWAPTVRFSGTERVTLELDGWFLPGALAVPRAAELELDALGRGRVSLFAFHVDDLKVAGLPILRASYAELLWRIAVRIGDRPMWWIAACDLGSRRARYLAGREIHYPVRAANVTVDFDQVRTEAGGGDLAISVGRPTHERVSPDRRTVITGPRAEWEVPWGDDGSGASLATATVEVDSLSTRTLGMSVAWAPVCLVRSGRLHRCGSARPR